MDNFKKELLNEATEKIETLCETRAKSFFLKEASLKIDDLNKQEDDIKSDLLIEASYRLQQDIEDESIKQSLLDFDKEHIKYAELQKSAMPAQIGAVNLANSYDNVSWTRSHTSEAMDRVAEQIREAFSNYCFKQIGRTRFKFDAPEMVFRFDYKRHLFPIKNVKYKATLNKSIEDIDNAIESSKVNGISTVAGKFSEFISDIESLGIPVLPFYHATQGGVTGTDFTSKESLHSLRLFIESQAKENKPLLMVDKDGRQIHIPRSKQYFSNHLDRMEDIGVSRREKRDRKFNRSEIQTIRSDRQLANAIGDKMQRGYRPNFKQMEEYFIWLKNKAFKDMNKPDYVSDKWSGQSIKDPHAFLIENKFAQQFARIKEAYSKGCLPMPEDSNEYEYTGFGQSPITKEQMRGLPLSGTGKYATCPVINTQDLRILLYFMTSYDPKKSTRLKPTSNVGPNDFVSTSYYLHQSNGWDSMAKDPSRTMPLIPAMRINNGQVQYDTDQSNLGHMHLTKYGVKIGELLRKWGEWSNKLFWLMQDPRNQNGPFKDKTAYETWKNVINNRTNSDSVLVQIINKYRNASYEQFKKQFLERSLASQIGQTKRQLSTSIAEQNTIILEQDLSLYRQYGYQMAKVMDFASALIRRSCEEIVQNRFDNGEVITEKFYGRTVSSSMGRGISEENNVGQVMLAVKYAYQADPVLTPEAAKTINKLMGYLGAPTEKLRATEHFQRGELAPDEIQPTGPNSHIKIMQTVKYFIGQTSSRANFILDLNSSKEYKNWEDAVNDFCNKYPSIPKDTDTIFPLISADLNSLQEKCKNGLIKVQNELLSTAHIPVELDFEVDTSNVTHSGETIVSEEIIEPQIHHNLSQEIQHPQEQHLPTPIVTPSEPSAVPQQENIPETTTETTTEQQKEKPDFVGRKQTGRSLLKKQINPTNSKIRKSSTIETLIKVADKLDQHGQTTISNKIDELINRLSKE